MKASSNNLCQSQEISCLITTKQSGIGFYDNYINDNLVNNINTDHSPLRSHQFRFSVLSVSDQRKIESVIHSLLHQRGVILQYSVDLDQSKFQHFRIVELKVQYSQTRHHVLIVTTSCVFNPDSVYSLRTTNILLYIHLHFFLRFLISFPSSERCERLD